MCHPQGLVERKWTECVGVHAVLGLVQVSELFGKPAVSCACALSTPCAF